MHDQHINHESKLLASLGDIVPVDAKIRAKRFAEHHGLTLVSYSPQLAEWRMSDGEVYSTNLIEHEYLYNSQEV